MAEAIDPSTRFENLLQECRNHAALDQTFNSQNNLIEKSEKAIKDLEVLGFNLIENVSVSSKTRTRNEGLQTGELIKNCGNLLQKNQSENQEDIIVLNKLWQNALEIKVPQELQKNIQELQVSSEAILHKQQLIIEDLRNELQKLDDNFCENIEKQSEDFSELRKRTSYHMRTIREGYKEGLQNTDMALNSNFKNLLSDSDEFLKNVFKEFSDCEDFCLSQIITNSDIWDQNIQETEEEYYQEAIKLKTKLLSDVQKVELEVERVKAEVLLNSEMLDYNCQILKLREEEHIALKANQKRKIRRLTDNYRLLRQQYETVTKTRQQKRRDLLRVIEKSENENEQLLEKLGIIKTANQKKLQNLWKMTEESIDKLINEILEADTELAVRVIGKPWSAGEQIQLSCEEKEAGKNAALHLQNPEEIRRYFQSVRNKVPQPRRDLWKMMAKALMKYSEIIKDRNSLMADYLNHTSN